MKTIICAVSMILAVATAKAMAEEDTHSARFMLPYCKLSSRQTMATPKNALIYGQCFGTISGVVMMTEVLRQARAAGKADPDPALCVEIPGDTTILQLIDRVVKYGEAHPDQGRERFEVVAFNALRDAWPCGK
jgi:Ssp1 endopeptidase immunity protein Rap1a